MRGGEEGRETERVIETETTKERKRGKQQERAKKNGHYKFEKEHTLSEG